MRQRFYMIWRRKFLGIGEDQIPRRQERTSERPVATTCLADGLLFARRSVPPGDIGDQIDVARIVEEADLTGRTYFNDHQIGPDIICWSIQVGR